MRVYHSVAELIGRTPLLELDRLEKELDLKAKLLVKLEKQNPGGSVKDRAALFMIQDAEKKGLLQPGGTIIEPTSGNTGIGLCSLAADRGYRAIIVMPDTMSMERRLLMKAYGAELVLTPGAQGMKGAIAKAEELAKEIPGSWIPAQFDNPANPMAHMQTTGPEIWEDTEGQVDIFVAGIGSGGTVSGVGRYLKSRSDKVEIIGVEPEGSPFLTRGIAGPHKIQGIGAGFQPKNLDLETCDRIVTVADQDAMETGRLLARKQGILSGVSSGAALWAAIQEAKKPENAGKTVVALLPDTGERYLSTPMFQE